MGSSKDKEVDSKGGIKLLLGGVAEGTCDVRPPGGVLEFSPVASRWSGVGLQTLWGKSHFIFFLALYLEKLAYSMHASHKVGLYKCSVRV